MPKFDASFQSQNGLDLRDFDRFSRDWFPTMPTGAGVLTTTEVWPFQELAAVDAAQRALTTSLGLSSGIPFLAGQAAAQTNFLGASPALQASSAIARTFEDALRGGLDPRQSFEAALGVINELGFDALQGAVGAAQGITGAIGMVPFVGAFFSLGQLYGELLWQTFKPKDAKALRVSTPAYDPDNDFNAAAIAHGAASGRDWTSVFSPAPADLPLETGGFTFTGIAGTTRAPHFAGRRTEQDGLWLYSQMGGSFGTSIRVLPGTAEHWGFVPLWGEGASNGGPRPDARPGGGVLWRGVLIDRKRNYAPTLVGDSLPTSQAMGLSMWRAVNNPYGPQIFFVDAVELGRQWLNYLVQLRRGLHYSHTKDAYQRLKDISGSTIDGGGAMQARLWLSFSKVEGGDLYKQREIRRAACNALVPVFGWPEWQADEDEMVRKLEDVEAISDAEYIDKFDLNNAAPVVACRELFKRQTEATQAVTVLYSREDDPAFRSHAPLRRLRDRCVQKAVNIPQIRGAADSDMVDPALIKQAGQQLWNPSSPVAAFDPARKSQTYLIKDVWVGDAPPPGIWAGKLNLTSLPAMKKLDLGTPGAAGGGAGLLLLGLGAAGAFIATRRRK